MARHHSKKLGCQASRAFCSFLSCDKLTLFGILANSSDINLRPFPGELGALGATIHGESAARPDGIGALKDPVLPRRQAPEDFGLEGLRAGETQVGFEAREAVGR